GDERKRVDLLDASAVSVFDQAVRGREVDPDLAGMSRVVRLHSGEILQCPLRAVLDQLACTCRRDVARAEAPEPAFDGHGRETVAEELLRLDTDGVVSGDEQGGTAPRPAERRV